MREIESIEEFEFDILKEIPKDTIKEQSVSNEDIKKVLDGIYNINLNCSSPNLEYWECICEFEEWTIWKQISKGWNDLKTQLYVDTDGNKFADTKQVYLNIGGKMIEFRKTKIFLSDEFTKEVERLSIIENENGIKYNKLGSYESYFQIRELLVRVANNGLVAIDSLIKDKELYLDSLEKERLAEEEKELLKKKDKEINKQEDYEKKGIADFVIGYEKYNLVGNILKMENTEHKWVFKKPLNELLPFNWWETIRENRGEIEGVELYFIEKKISFNKYVSKKRYPYKERFYVVDFKNDKMLIDTIEIPKAKQVFFLKRAIGSADRIKFLKKMSARGLQLLDCSNIDIYNNGKSISIPFKAETEDGITYKIELMSRDFEVSFDKLKEIFFRGNDLHIVSPSRETLCNFVIELGATKQELFEHIKRVLMLKTLGEENENN